VDDAVEKYDPVSRITPEKDLVSTMVNIPGYPSFCPSTLPNTVTVVRYRSARRARTSGRPTSTPHPSSTLQSSRTSPAYRPPPTSRSRGSVRPPRPYLRQEAFEVISTEDGGKKEYLEVGWFEGTPSEDWGPGDEGFLGKVWGEAGGLYQRMFLGWTSGLSGVASLRWWRILASG